MNQLSRTTWIIFGVLFSFAAFVLLTLLWLLLEPNVEQAINHIEESKWLWRLSFGGLVSIVFLAMRCLLFMVWHFLRVKALYVRLRNVDHG